MFFAFANKVLIEDWVSTTLDFENDSALSWISAYSISVILSMAFYVNASKILKSLLSAPTLMKAKIFGDYYLEGSWVGFYPSSEGTSYIVERISQDMDKCKVEGMSFRIESEQWCANCTWDSFIMEIEYGKPNFYYAYNNTDIPKTRSQNLDSIAKEANNGRSDQSQKLKYEGFARFKIEAAKRSDSDFLSTLDPKYNLSRLFKMRGELQDFRNETARPPVQEIKVSTSKQIDYFELAKLAYQYEQFVNNQSKI